MRIEARLLQDGKYQEALALLQQKAVEVQANPEAKKIIDDAVVQIELALGAERIHLAASGEFPSHSSSLAV